MSSSVHVFFRFFSTVFTIWSREACYMSLMSPDLALPVSPPCPFPPNHFFRAFDGSITESQATGVFCIHLGPAYHHLTDSVLLPDRQHAPTWPLSDVWPQSMTNIFWKKEINPIKGNLANIVRIFFFYFFFDKVDDSKTERGYLKRLISFKGQLFLELLENDWHNTAWLVHCVIILSDSKNNFHKWLMPLITPSFFESSTLVRDMSTIFRNSRNS